MSIYHCSIKIISRAEGVPLLPRLHIVRAKNCTMMKLEFFMILQVRVALL